MVLMPGGLAPPCTKLLSLANTEDFDASFSLHSRLFSESCSSLETNGNKRSLSARALFVEGICSSESAVDFQET